MAATVDGTSLSSASKTLALLAAFRLGPGTATLTELAGESGIAKSTAHRLLAVLCEAGFVDRRGTDYFLSSSLFELGARALNGEAGLVRDAALPFMTDLYEQSHENVHLAILDRGEVLYLERLHGHRSAPSPAKIGHRLPSHATALGKAVLAFSGADVVELVMSCELRRLTPRTVVAPGLLIRQLHQIRRDRVAYDFEESQLGVACVAAPVLTPSGRAVAALSICGSAVSFDPVSFAKRVRIAAYRISARLGDGAGLVLNGDAGYEVPARK